MANRHQHQQQEQAVKGARLRNNRPPNLVLSKGESSRESPRLDRLALQRALADEHDELSQPSRQIPKQILVSNSHASSRLNNLYSYQVNSPVVDF